MALLITGTACGLFSFAAALILQFRFPGWTQLSGLSRMRTERRANVDERRLVRLLSVLFYLLAAGFLGGSLLLSIKAVTESALMPLYFLLAGVVFDLVWLCFRKLDRNEYPAAARRAGRVYFLTVNLAFLALCFVFAR